MTFPTKVVVQTLVHLSLNSCEFSYDRRGNRLLSETSCIAFLATLRVSVRIGREQCGEGVTKKKRGLVAASATSPLLKHHSTSFMPSMATQQA